MMSTNNIFSPANGQPIISPSQDIVMGCYYLTADPLAAFDQRGGSDEDRAKLAGGEGRRAKFDNLKGEDMKFASPAEVFLAFAQKKVGVHARMKETGFRESTRSGLSFSTDDLRTPHTKDTILQTTEKEVDRIQKQFLRGIITEGERYNRIIDQ